MLLMTLLEKKIVEKQDDWRKMNVELDSNKSKKSLAEIYEEEYQEKVEGHKKEDPLTIQQQRVLRKFRKLCETLDALSNVSTVRKSKIIKNQSQKPDMPAIRMEEVTPTTVSSVSQLAPEEIFERHEMEQGTTEKTKEDRKRERKEKKSHRKRIQKQKSNVVGEVDKKSEEDIKKGSIEKAVKQIKESGDRNVKFVHGVDTTNYSQSTALFKKLQEDAKKEAQALKDAKLGTGSISSQKDNKRDSSANNWKL